MVAGEQPQTNVDTESLKDWLIKGNDAAQQAGACTHVKPYLGQTCEVWQLGRGLLLVLSVGASCTRFN